MERNESREKDLVKKDIKTLKVLDKPLEEHIRNVQRGFSSITPVLGKVSRPSIFNKLLDPEKAKIQMEEYRQKLGIETATRVELFKQEVLGILNCHNKYIEERTELFKKGIEKFCQEITCNLEERTQRKIQNSFIRLADETKECLEKIEQQDLPESIKRIYIENTIKACEITVNNIIKTLSSSI